MLQWCRINSLFQIRDIFSWMSLLVSLQVTLVLRVLLVDRGRVLRMTNVAVQRLSGFLQPFFLSFFSSDIQKESVIQQNGIFLKYYSSLIWGAIPHWLLWWQNQFKKWQPCFLLLSCCKNLCQYIGLLGSRVKWGVYKHTLGFIFPIWITSVICFRNGLMYTWRRGVGYLWPEERGAKVNSSLVSFARQDWSEAVPSVN